MARQSAGILPYRWKDDQLEVFLVHPGGPFWVNKDLGAWSIPKGEFDESEEALAAARREFLEETSMSIEGPFIELTPVKLKSGKVVYAWAAQKDIDLSRVVSNTFKMEWPARSGKWKSFPEIDRADWFHPRTAIQKVNPAQAAFVRELAGKLGLDFDL